MYLNRNKNKMNVKASFYSTIILLGERVPLNHVTSFLSKQCLLPSMPRSVFFANWFGKNLEIQAMVQPFFSMRLNQPLSRKHNKNHTTRNAYH